MIGTGSQLKQPSMEVRKYVNSLGINLEVADTSRAGSPFNVLSEEGRSIIALLFPKSTWCTSRYYGENKIRWLLIVVHMRLFRKYLEQRMIMEYLFWKSSIGLWLLKRPVTKLRRMPEGTFKSHPCPLCKITAWSDRASSFGVAQEAAD